MSKPETPADDFQAIKVSELRDQLSLLMAAANKIVQELARRRDAGDPESN